MKKFLLLIIVVSAILALTLAGCGGTNTQPPSPTQPAMCYLRVASTSPNVWGYVWVNGMNTGVYLNAMGVAQVGPYSCGQQASVQIIDEFGQQSHIEIANLSGPITTVNFAWW